MTSTQMWGSVGFRTAPFHRSWQSDELYLYAILREEDKKVGSGLGKVESALSDVAPFKQATRLPSRQIAALPWLQPRPRRGLECSPRVCTNSLTRLNSPPAATLSSFRILPTKLYC